MSVLKSGFVQGFIRMATDGWDAGWHECNGGNMSYRLSKKDVAEVSESMKPCEWRNMAGAIHVPGLAGEYLLVTAAGSFFRNVQLEPKKCLGIIEIDKDGRRWRKVWGFKGGGQPTSELPAHLLCHEARKTATGGKSRVVYHAHPANLIALTFALPLDSQVFTRELWRAISECSIVLPEGVGVLKWMGPGSTELARATSESMETHNAVVWAHHGAFVAGESFDSAFGLVHTIEKAAEVVVKVRSMARPEV